MAETEPPVPECVWVFVDARGGSPSSRASWGVDGPPVVMLTVLWLWVLEPPVVFAVPLPLMNWLS